jgi:hypothetical protein
LPQRVCSLLTVSVLGMRYARNGRSLSDRRELSVIATEGLVWEPDRAYVQGPRIRTFSVILDVSDFVTKVSNVA